MGLDSNYLQRIFLYTVGGNRGATQFNVANRHMPMLNNINNSLSSYMAEQGQINKKKALMAWYKTIPELTGFVNKIAGDMTARYHFENVNPKESGRNKILKANTFAQEVVLSQTMEEIAADQLITGEGFGWLGKISDVKLKEAIYAKLKTKALQPIERKELADKFYLDIKQTELLGNVSAVDEDILKPRKYRVLPSSTMEIMFDDFDIIEYNHIVGIKKITFKPAEVVHYTLMRRDGKPSGFTSIETVLTQLELLRQMWQNMMSVHKNGGAMDKIISFENERSDSPSFKKTAQEFTKYKQVENRHGLYLTTGKINVQDLQNLDDMQFETMGLYVTGVLALQWGIPRSSIPFIQGGVNTKDDTGGNTERGYWEVIRKFQHLYMETMNTQLWIPYFGVKIVLENPYFQLDVQEQTYKQMKYNNIKLVDEMAQVNKKRFKFSEKVRLLDMDIDMFEDIPEEDLMMNQPAGTLDKQLSKSDVNDSDAKKNQNDKKKKEQTSTIQSAGKPTGVGKEFFYGVWSKAADKELLESKEVESETVSFDKFVDLYNSDKGINPLSPPRMFLRSSTDMTTFFFKSTDFTFKTTLNDIEYETNRIRILNLTDGKIWRV